MIDDASPGSRIFEAELPNKARVLVRAREIDGSGAEKVGWDDRLDFRGVADAVGGIADALRESLAKAAPRKVTVELGVEIAVKAGKLTGLLVDGEGKGSLKLTLEWSGTPGANG